MKLSDARPAVAGQPASGSTLFSAGALSLADLAAAATCDEGGPGGTGKNKADFTEVDEKSSVCVCMPLCR